MSENSHNRNSDKYLLKQKDQYTQYNTQDEVKKFKIDKMKLNKIKKNLLFNDTINFKTNSKKLLLNNTGDSIFSNIELKKYINDTNKINFRKGNNYFLRKLENLNNNEYIGNYSNNTNQDEVFKFNRKELKEESTNTYNNNNNEINNYEYEIQGINSLDSNSNNTREMQIIQSKTAQHKLNNNINLMKYRKELLNDTKNKIAENLNSIKNITFNNINLNNKISKNHNKFYLELYNFNLLQSIIQKRSVFFDFKKKNLFGTQIPKSPKPVNLTLFLNKQNNKNLSLRELYRNLNKQNDSFNMMRLKLKKKDKWKMKRIKTYDGTNVKKPKIVFERNNKYNLMNVQYNLNKNDKDIFKDMHNIFKKTFFSKRISNINNNIFKLKSKTESQTKNFMKTNYNLQNNLLMKKNQKFNYDELDIGLTNSSSQIKTFLNKHLKKSNKFRITTN